MAHQVQLPGVEELVACRRLPTPLPSSPFFNPNQPLATSLLQTPFHRTSLSPSRRTNDLLSLDSSHDLLEYRGNLGRTYEERLEERQRKEKELKAPGGQVHSIMPLARILNPNYQPTIRASDSRSPHKPVAPCRAENLDTYPPLFLEVLGQSAAYEGPGEVVYEVIDCMPGDHGGESTVAVFTERHTANQEATKRFIRAHWMAVMEADEDPQMELSLEGLVQISVVSMELTRRVYVKKTRVRE